LVLAAGLIGGLTSWALGHALGEASRANWGNTAEWFAGIATALAVGAAVYLAQSERQHRRSERLAANYNLIFLAGKLIVDIDLDRPLTDEEKSFGHAKLVREQIRLDEVYPPALVEPFWSILFWVDDIRPFITCRTHRDAGGYLDAEASRRVRIAQKRVNRDLEEIRAAVRANPLLAITSRDLVTVR
jgi:hypothetical protein